METTIQDDDSPFESKDDVPNESSANVDFKSDQDDQKTTSLEVDAEQLKSIAETGIVDLDWPTLQQALKDRLDEVIEKYHEKNPDCKEEQYQEPNVGKFNLEDSKDEILELIASFNEAPFTIQRICELLYSPFKYYDKTSTFLRGLEKNLRVISSNDWPKSPNNHQMVVNENNCTSTNSSAIQQATASSSEQSSQHEQQQHQYQQEQEQQHEDMNQCEDQQQILVQPPAPEVPSETQLEPTSSTASSSSSMSSTPPSTAAELPSPIKEVT